MKTELVETIYSLLPRTKIVYRVTHNNNRIYYTFENSEVELYLSLTTMIRATLPKSEQLIKWQCETGYEAAKKYMNERADYGSLMHLVFGKYIMEKKYDFSTTEKFCLEMAHKNGYQFKEDWVSDLNDDLAAFIQFIIDYKVEPLAVEIVLVSKDGYGTLIDLVCNMTIQVDGFDGNDPYKTGARKGQPREVKVDKKITALLNFKSGRKGFYEEMEVQLEFEKRLFCENYPDIKIDKIYNWSPKEWRDAPTYNLKDQSDSLNIEKAEALLNIARIELFKRAPQIKTVEGLVTYGQPAKVTTVSLKDHLKELHTSIIELESQSDKGLTTDTITEMVPAGYENGNGTEITKTA